MPTRRVDDPTPATEATVEVSVVIACLDSAETLGVMLASLAEQAWDGNWEVIVADNGSSDDTRAVAEGFRSRLPALRVVDASGIRGVAHGRNVGAAHARGVALLFPDSDDAVEPSYLAHMAAALRRFEFVACRLAYDRLNSGVARLARGDTQGTGLQSYDDPPFLPHAAGTSLGVRAETLERLGGFDVAMVRLSDTEFCWRAQLAGVPLVFVPEAVVQYRNRPTLWSNYLQARRYGEYTGELSRRFRDRGMPRASLRGGLLRWFGLLRRAPDLLDGRRRPRLVRDFGFRFGRLLGVLGALGSVDRPALREAAEVAERERVRGLS